MARHFKRSGNDKNTKTRLAALIVCAVLLVCFVAAPEYNQLQKILNINALKDKIIINMETALQSQDPHLILKQACLCLQLFRIS